ncbi:MAG: hypothetical protein DRO01_05565 [Thermoproteota archaeon]|nr:MAG: hypothetical protein DRO01_05565 [Candidatus Korarchaeota archaeon]
MEQLIMMTQVLSKQEKPFTHPLKLRPSVGEIIAAWRLTQMGEPSGIWENMQKRLLIIRITIMAIILLG